MCFGLAGGSKKNRRQGGAETQRKAESRDTPAGEESEHTRHNLQAVA